jgi:hypothetical protein
MSATIKILTMTFLLILLSACTIQNNQKAVNVQSPQASQGKAEAAPNLELLAESSVESMQIEGGLPGTPGSALYSKSDANGVAVITKVTGWLNASIPTDGPTNVGKHGYPQDLKVVMANGDTAVIEPAYNCVAKTNDDGSSQKTCSAVKREVIFTHDKSSVRLISPELYDWVQGGWKQEK